MKINYDATVDSVERAARQIAVLQGGILAILVLFTILGAAVAYTQSPPVGGEWWPYIHVAVTIVGAAAGFIVGKVVAIVAFLVGLFLISEELDVELM